MTATPPFSHPAPGSSLQVHRNLEGYVGKMAAVALMTCSRIFPIGQRPLTNIGPVLSLKKLARFEPNWRRLNGEDVRREDWQWLRLNR